MIRPLLLAALIASALPAAATAADPGLTTVAERSGFLRTGRYDEVVALCAAFAQRYPQAVRCADFGTTPEGRPMKVLIASTSGALTPEAARARGLPVTLVQGGIHAGEIDGKDAGFLALREMLDGQAAPGALERQVLLFVPVFNVDGHERFRAWNRPNQRGPEEMGWRTTAQNYNLNRDYAKADSPEMQAMLALVEAWDPLVYVDLHVTDGAKFEHDVSIQVEPVHAGDERLRRAGTALRDGVIARLAKQGSLPLPFYPSFVQYDDPASGFEDDVATPRFSHGYFFLRNRIGMLVETHSWRDYPHRVRVTRNTVLATLDLVARHGRAWLRQAREADARAAKLGGQPVPLDYQATGQARTIAFRGYAYTRTSSEVSGALMTRYDESRPQIWRVPLRDRIVPALTVTAPKGGYLVPAAHAARVGAKLDQHGIGYRRLDAALAGAQVEAFRADQAEFSNQSVEGHQRTTLAGAWRRETRDVSAGALFVPIAQPKARLAMALLEPQAPDALAAWGEFNNAFERKEYMEDYVAEEVAREMLRDPQVKAEFERRLREDPAFAKDPQARLEFFARRHASWDDRYNLYPVLRTDAVPR
ncbi:M14 family metallopeptidase [Vulcaniibacterium tengchongense]|uniref:Zinc carboxypeptidase n=1 Tax=Vulcaniibacterium tengchongense TaxID=1273429 RepID=A0A3N4VFT0_9GAMM|nr:M14 family metallopeptidase [Vulcaniibacterium tengchongense]RPE81882.1 zinc carboxypeptidase [Vulcaniibacterium tengchongense]